MSDDVALLKRVPLFHSVADRDLEQLAKLLRRVHFHEGRILFHYGDPGDTMYIIISGSVKFFHRDAAGNERLLEEAGEGRIFGEVAVLHGGTRSATAQVTQEMVALELHRTDLERFLLHHPKVTMGILHEMAWRLRQSGEQIRQLPMTSARERLAVTETSFDRWIRNSARFCASLPFLVINAVFYGSWILVNLWPREPHFDPFPFGLLGVLIAVETACITIIVLNNQHRQDELENLREELMHEDNERMITELHRKFDDLRTEILSQPKPQALLPRVEEPSGT